MISHKQFLQMPKDSISFFAAISISRGMFDHANFDNFSDDDFDLTEQAIINGEFLPDSYYEPIIDYLFGEEILAFNRLWDARG